MLAVNKKKPIKDQKKQDQYWALFQDILNEEDINKLKLRLKNK